MRKQLLIEYKTPNKTSRMIKMQADGVPHTIGSARRAHLQIVGKDISAYHTGLEYRDGDWYIFDMASESGTWVAKENIVERKIEDKLDVRIGDHDFKLKIIPAPHTLFNFEERRNVTPDIHEVVVKANGKIIETHYLDKNEPYMFNNGMGGYITMPPPTSTAWVRKEIAGYYIQQRLRTRPKALEVPNKKSPAEQKMHYIITGVGFLMVLLGIYFFPKEPKMDLPIEQNKYSRLIYDSKLVQEKRKQARVAEKKFRPSTEGQGAKGEAASSQAVAKSLAKSGASQKTVTAISQIRASGLKNLLGRISARANVSGIAVQASGSGSNKATNQISGITGASVNGTGFSNVKDTGESVGGGAVGTAGKGGGGQGYQGFGKLAQGEIGQAGSVGMLDEEADVSGGMDKDAIAEVIRSNIGQIRFCYERRLSAVPNLYGKVLVQFNIQEGGVVALPKVAQSSLSDSVVEGCILRRLASWKFPSPPAGMSVVVTYPFLFKSTQ